jgi:hypothetical protein
MCCTSSPLLLSTCSAHWYGETLFLSLGVAGVRPVFRVRALLTGIVNKLKARLSGRVGPTLIYLACTTRLSAYVLILVLQGALVAGVHTLAFFGDFRWSHIVVAGAVLLVRTVLIPSYIVKIMHQLDMGHDDRTRRYHLGFLIQMVAVVMGAFFISHQLSRLAAVSVILWRPPSQASRPAVS